jgi:hypothetical protein
MRAAVGKMRHLPLSSKHRQRGATALETALLIPFLFLFILYGLQIGFIFLSHQVTQYAAYMAARSYMVYGESGLSAIDYPYSAQGLGVGDEGGLLTSDRQSIAEAAAEKIIFESLPWEHTRIVVTDTNDWYMKRLYRDGVDASNSVNNGAVRVDFGTDPAFHSFGGLRLTYCMPVLFPGLETFFTGNFSSLEDNANPCDNLRSPSSSGFGDKVAAIPIQHAFYLGREP